MAGESDSLLWPCRPCLEYSSVWNSCSAHGAHSLEKVQLLLARSAAALHLPGSALSLSKSSLLQILNQLTLAWRRRSKLILFWQLVHGFGPPPLHKLFFVRSRCSYNLRNSNSLGVPSCSSSSHSPSFLPSCCLLWNRLPVFIPSCSSLSSLLLLLTQTLMMTSFLGLPA